MHMSQTISEEKANNEIACVTCGQSLQGSYCSYCGEKKLDKHDRRIVSLFEEFIHSFTHADNKFLRSLKYLFTRPGFLTNEYLGGRRKLYSKPLSLFFIANIIYLFYAPVDTFNSRFLTVIEGQPYSEALMPQVHAKMQKRQWTLEQLAERYDERSAHEAKLLLIAFVFLLSVPAALLFISRKRYYYDYVVFSIEYVNFIMYGIMLLVPWLVMLTAKAVLLMKGGGTAHINVNSGLAYLSALLLLWSFLIVATRRVFKQQWWLTIIKAAILTFCTIVAMFLYRFIAFEATMLLL
jgi:hypothetical protein